VGKFGFGTRPAALTALTLLAVAACGTGPGSPGPSPTTGTAPPPAPTTTAPPAPATTGKPGTTTPATPVRQCTTAALAVKLGPSEGAAGHRYTPIVFTNTGGSCRITGYPGVSFYAGGDHHQVGEAATRDAGSTPAVVLQRGQSASAWVDQLNPGLFDPAQCGPTPVTGLRVYPPGNTVPVLLPQADAQACAKVIPGQRLLSVRAVQRGSGEN